MAANSTPLRPYNLAVGSLAITVVADTTAPSAPVISAAALSDSQIRVSITTPSTDTGGSGLAGYRVFRNGSTSIIATLAANATFYDDTGLTSGQAYNYQFRAFDGATNVSALSNTASATALDSVAPSAPGVPTISAITSTTATVTWTAATDNVGVTGYESSLDGSSWTNRGNVLTYSQTGLAAGTAYTIRVRAYDAAGNRGTAATAGTFTTLGGTGISFPASVATQVFSQNIAGQTLDLDSLLATGAPAAGWAVDGTLPTGLSLDTSTGVVSGTPTTVQTVAVTVYASNVSKVDAEFSKIRSQSGVIWATNFATDTEVVGPDPNNNGGSDTTFFNAYQQKPDLSPGISPYISRVPTGGMGNGSFMRMTFPGSLADSNVGGWRRMFVDGQKLWPTNQDLYISYVNRVTAAMLGMTQFDNWKIALLAGYGRSGWGQTCQTNEISHFNQKSPRNNIFTWYTDCGSGHIITDGFPTPSNQRYQNLVDKGPSETNLNRRYCSYDQFIEQPTGACYRLPGDTWFETYYRLRLNTDGTLFFRTEIAFEGSTVRTPLNEYAAWSPWTLQSASSECFNTLTFTLQTTGRNGTSPVDMQMDVQRVVVSTSPIPAITVWA